MKKVGIVILFFFIGLIFAQAYIPVIGVADFTESPSAKVTVGILREFFQSWKVPYNYLRILNILISIR